MNKSMVGALAGLGGLLLVVGLILGLHEHTVARSAGVAPLPCGSGWSPDYTEARDQDDVLDIVVGRRYGLPSVGNYEEKCEKEIGGQGILATILAVLGAMTLIGAGFVIAAKSSAPAKTSSGEQNPNEPTSGDDGVAVERPGSSPPR